MKARPICRARSSSSSACTERLLALEASERTAAIADGPASTAMPGAHCTRSQLPHPPSTEHSCRIYRCSVRHDRGGHWMARSRHARRPPRPRLTLPEVQPAGTGESTFMRLVEAAVARSEEHTSELQSRVDLVCRL